MRDGHFLTVSELNRQVKHILESSLPVVWVQGEISNFTWHTSGHMYFTLKDQYAQLRCIMWKTYNQHLFFTPGEGLKVQVQGKVTVYEKGGQYQLSAYQMQPLGMGDLRLAFEHLANKLRAEGLFEQEHKKPLPRFPSRIGLATSPDGAAIEDILRVVARRFPPAQVILQPVAVQGSGAAEQIARAIESFNRGRIVEVIIVGRGGGSPEDLWAFNEEVVARAIFASHIPVISAVGHEIDLTISDLVADLRAPTPSAAGEMVVPDIREVMTLLETMAGRLTRTLEHQVQRRRQHLGSLWNSHGMRRPQDLMIKNWQMLESCRQHLHGSWARFHQLSRSDLETIAEKLIALDPEAVLERGYSICRRLSDLSIISDARCLQPAELIEVTFARGSVEGSVNRVRKQGLRRRTKSRSNGLEDDV